MNCGVYLLEFPDGSSYVGASKNIRTRTQTHFSWLRKGKGQTCLLQERFDKFGYPEVKVVVVCEPENLRLYEMIVYKTVSKPLCKPVGGGIAGKTVTHTARANMAAAARNKDQSCQSKRQLETWADPEIRERRVSALRKYFAERKANVTKSR